MARLFPHNHRLDRERMKIFISMTQTPEIRAVLHPLMMQLMRVSQNAITADMIPSDISPTERAQAVLELFTEVDLFIGIYGPTYDALISGQDVSYSEQEYWLADESDLTCLIFMPEAALATSDERVLAFKAHLEQNHVIHTYTDTDELLARLLIEVAKFREQRRQGRRLRTSGTGQFRPAVLNPKTESTLTEEVRTLPPMEDDLARRLSTVTAVEVGGAPQPEPTPEAVVDHLEAMAASDELADMVERALDMASDDIEQIVRRALELHDAQHAMRSTVTHGWLSVNPIFGEPMTNSQFQSDIFMIMPFRPQYDAVYRNKIVPLVADLNLTIKRGDEFSSLSGSIMREVWAAINACRLVIAETTDINPNVFYELGIAHTLGKPAILLTQHTEVEDLPFDIRHLRFIVYEDTIQGGEKLKQDLKRAILWIMNDLKPADRSEDETS